MNKETLVSELIADEGEVLSIYICTAGHETCGVGHMVRESDPEYGWPVGAPITKERSDELLKEDLKTVLNDCEWVITGFDVLPEEVQLIIANMMFNLGRPRFSKFVKLISAVEAADWGEAARQMEDSRWHVQLPERSGRLIARMRAVA
jgi:lysozyme